MVGIGSPSSGGENTESWSWFVYYIKLNYDTGYSSVQYMGLSIQINKEIQLNGIQVYQGGRFI